MSDTRLRITLYIMVCCAILAGYLAGAAVTAYASGRYWSGQVEAMQAGIDALENQVPAAKHQASIITL